MNMSRTAVRFVSLLILGLSSLSAQAEFPSLPSPASVWGSIKNTFDPPPTPEDPAIQRCRDRVRNAAERLSHFVSRRPFTMEQSAELRRRVQIVTDQWKVVIADKQISAQECASFEPKVKDAYNYIDTTDKLNFATDKKVIDDLKTCFVKQDMNEGVRLRKLREEMDKQHVMYTRDLNELFDQAVSQPRAALLDKLNKNFGTEDLTVYRIECDHLATSYVKVLEASHAHLETGLAGNACMVAYPKEKAALEATLRASPELRDRDRRTQDLVNGVETVRREFERLGFVTPQDCKRLRDTTTQADKEIFQRSESANEAKSCMKNEVTPGYEAFRKAGAAYQEKRGREMNGPERSGLETIYPHVREYEKIRQPERLYMKEDCAKFKEILAAAKKTLAGLESTPWADWQKCIDTNRANERTFFGRVQKFLDMRPAAANATEADNLRKTYGNAAQAADSDHYQSLEECRNLTAMLNSANTRMDALEKGSVAVGLPATPPPKVVQPAPPSPPTAASVTTCEHGSADMKCPSGKLITIRTAMFGRTEAGICPGPGSNNTKCVSGSNTLQVVAMRCNGKQQCAVTAEASVLGDPCYGTSKYLKVDYVCL